MDVVGTSSRHAAAHVVRAGSPARIDPTEWQGLAIGTPLGLIGGGIVGSLVAGSGAMRQGLQGTAAMDRALLSGGAMGALTGALAGLAVGFMVGHIRDEGWTMPGQ